MASFTNCTPCPVKVKQWTREKWHIFLHNNGRTFFNFCKYNNGIHRKVDARYLCVVEFPIHLSIQTVNSNDVVDKNVPPWQFWPSPTFPYYTFQICNSQKKITRLYSRSQEMRTRSQLMSNIFPSIMENYT